MDTEALPGVLQDTGANTPERRPSEGSGGAPDTMRKAEATSPDPFGLVTEAEAYRIYRHLLEDKELRRARAAGLIGYLRRKRTIHYRRDELDAFVRAVVQQGYVEPCQSLPPQSTRARTTTPRPTPRGSDDPPAASGTVTEATLRAAAERLRRRPCAMR